MKLGSFYSSAAKLVTGIDPFLSLSITSSSVASKKKQASVEANKKNFDPV